MFCLFYFFFDKVLPIFYIYFLLLFSFSFFFFFSFFNCSNNKTKQNKRKENKQNTTPHKGDSDHCLSKLFLSRLYPQKSLQRKGTSTKMNPRFRRGDSCIFQFPVSVQPQFFIIIFFFLPLFSNFLFKPLSISLNYVL